MSEAKPSTALEYVKKLDFLSTPISLTIDGQRQHRTLIGSFLGLTVILVIMAYGSNELITKATADYEYRITERVVDYTYQEKLHMKHNLLDLGMNPHLFFMTQKAKNYTTTGFTKEAIPKGPKVIDGEDLLFTNMNFDYCTASPKYE